MAKVRALGRASRRTWVAAGLGGAATAVVLLIPTLRIGHHDVGAHVALETTATLIGSLVAEPPFPALRPLSPHPPPPGNSLLVYAMALLSLTALLSVARPGLLDDGSSTVGIWAAPLVRLMGAMLILAAALVPPTRAHRVASPAGEAARMVASLVTVSFIVLLLDSRLPALVDVRATAGDA